MVRSLHLLLKVRDYWFACHQQKAVTITIFTVMMKIRN